ncbi:hypothetical protein BBJ28_00014519 [Nothophytophthora sp. Chile5]|nr:hypothetical protein BBJ28_00014519 [Nothophytophthora sp. Chile5]
MVVTRSPTRPGRREALLDDQRRVQMELRAGDARQIVVMASPEEARAAFAAARPTPSPLAANTARPTAMETQRLLLAHAHRARHFLARRSTLNGLSRVRRSEMVDEIQRMKKTIKTLEQQIEVTTRSVESMDRLVFHLQRLTHEFLDPDTSSRDSVIISDATRVDLTTGLNSPQIIYPMVDDDRPASQSEEGE